MSLNPPRLTVFPVSSLNLDYWDQIEVAFAKAKFVPFQQGWCDTPSSAFEPARAAALYNQTHLFVYGEMDDGDIYNSIPEDELNRLSIQFGDVFEIFLQPAGQDAYFELHINPNNQKFQLRIPFPYAFQKLSQNGKNSGELIEEFKCFSPVIESRVQLLPEQGRWRVIAAIPFSMVVENTPVAPGVEWRFSFSRYDYTRPEPQPDYSSTSPHAQINFHRIEEWGTLVFGDSTAQ